MLAARVLIKSRSRTKDVAESIWHFAKAILPVMAAHLVASVEA
jgi:hypothetical protein